MTERSPSEPLKVRGVVVNTDDAQQDARRARRGGRVGEQSGKDEAGNVRDPDPDPADAPKRPPPGTGGTDGAPTG